MKTLLAHLATGSSLSHEQATQAFELIMSGEATPAQVGALLAMIQVRGPSVDEIAGAAAVMRAKACSVQVPAGLRVIDTCGTGGDHAGTFNISTAAALVAAGAGRPRGVAVAKHGNRSVTSSSGSSQVLQALGVKLQVQPQTLTQSLEEAGICFCFAPAHHPAMKHAVPVRQDLGFRTIFNVLGPLTNPAGARRQVVGVFAPSLTEPIAGVLLRLGAEDAMVVCGQFDGGGGGVLDELSTAGLSRISRVRAGGIETSELDAADLGLPRTDAAALRVSDPETSAAMIRDVLAGRPGAARDIVCLNAAAALVVAGLAADLREGLLQARHAIDCGAAANALARLVAVTSSDPTPS